MDQSAVLRIFARLVGGLKLRVAHRNGLVLVPQLPSVTAWEDPMGSMALAQIGHSVGIQSSVMLPEIRGLCSTFSWLAYVIFSLLERIFLTC